MEGRSFNVLKKSWKRIKNDNMFDSPTLERSVGKRKVRPDDIEDMVDSLDCMSRIKRTKINCIDGLLAKVTDVQEGMDNGSFGLNTLRLQAAKRHADRAQ